MNEKDQRAIDGWLASDPAPATRFARFLKSRLHKFCWPRGKKRTTWHVVSYALEACVPAIPVLAGAYLVKSQPPAPAHWTACFVAVFAVLAGAAKRKIDAPLEDAHARDMFQRASEIFIKHKTKSQDKAEVKRACLTMLEAYVRAAFLLPPGSVGVALITYKGSGYSKLRIDARDMGSTRYMRDFASSKALGHHAAQAGPDPRPIQDIREFPRRFWNSPTGSKVAYRSIFIIPLGDFSVDIDGNISEFLPKGYISIDVNQPYVFYGNKATEMAVDCEQMADFLKTLI